MTVPASGSHETRRWSKPDSNSRSHLRRYRCEAQEYFEVGFHLVQRRWGKGFATEAATVYAAGPFGS